MPVKFGLEIRFSPDITHIRRYSETDADVEKHTTSIHPLWNKLGRVDKIDITEIVEQPENSKSLDDIF